jgi:secreted trypsin-like serine protease
VLTAGHCVTARGRVPTVVRLNDINLARDEATDITIEVAEIIKHPNYKIPRQYDDIALIRLASVVTFGKGLYPICLSTATTIEPEEIMTAIGFGFTESMIVC